MKDNKSLVCDDRKSCLCACQQGICESGEKLHAFLAFELHVRGVNRRPDGLVNRPGGFIKREKPFAVARNRNNTFWLSKLYLVTVLTELT